MIHFTVLILVIRIRKEALIIIFPMKTDNNGLLIIKQKYL